MNVKLCYTFIWFLFRELDHLENDPYSLCEKSLAARISNGDNSKSMMSKLL